MSEQVKDDGVRELIGVASTDTGSSKVSLSEYGEWIRIDMSRCVTRSVSVSEAKAIRRALGRLIRRIEGREPGQ